MRSVVTPLLVVTALVVIAVIALAGYHKLSVESRIRTLQAHLQSTSIDFTCKDMAPAEAMNLLHQKLAGQNPFFETCDFQLDFIELRRRADSEMRALGLNSLVGPEPRVTLDVQDIPGSECMHYVTELSGCVWVLRPEKVVVTGIGSTTDHRDPFERAIDVTTGRIEYAWYWAKLQMGLVPAPASGPDPFAP